VHLWRRGRWLTLVELLVATALGAILIGVATFVWIRSNAIFTTTVSRLEAYQRLRSVIDMHDSAMSAIFDRRHCETARIPFSKENRRRAAFRPFVRFSHK